VHDVVRAARPKSLLIGLADNVVGRGRQSVQGPRHGRVVLQAAEGEQTWHPPCIAGTNSRHLLTSSSRAAARCSMTATPTPRP
jgi:hypothetical protein